jgi:hypothetical protein
MQIALEEHDLVDGERRAIDRGLSVDGGKATIANASQPTATTPRSTRSAREARAASGSTASATTRGLLGEGKTSAPPR